MTAQEILNEIEIDNRNKQETPEESPNNDTPTEVGTEQALVEI